MSDSENITVDDVTSTVSSGSADNDDNFDNASEFSSDDDPYANLVSDDCCHVVHLLAGYFVLRIGIVAGMRQTQTPACFGQGVEGRGRGGRHLPLFSMEGLHY